MIKISPAAFESAFRRFLGLIEAQPDSGGPFKSFELGVAKRWEGYKTLIYAEARRRLDTEKWKPVFGDGLILHSVTRAIEIPKTRLYQNNNLVEWSARYGPDGVSHGKLIAARRKADARIDIEEAMYELYVKQAESPERSFDHLVVLLGARYDLLAYLFFLRDIEKYMPIKSSTFEEAFRLLGIDYELSGRCSWENYEGYLRRLESVQDMLNRQDIVPEIKGQVRLIDAHSFCWMLVEMKTSLPSSK